MTTVVPFDKLMDYVASSPLIWEAKACPVGTLVFSKFPTGIASRQNIALKTPLKTRNPVRCCESGFLFLFWDEF